MGPGQPADGPARTGPVALCSLPSRGLESAIRRGSPAAAVKPRKPRTCPSFPGTGAALERTWRTVPSRCRGRMCQFSQPVSFEVATVTTYLFADRSAAEWWKSPLGSPAVRQSWRISAWLRGAAPIAEWPLRGLWSGAGLTRLGALSVFVLHMLPGPSTAVSATPAARSAVSSRPRLSVGAPVLLRAGRGGGSDRRCRPTRLLRLHRGLRPVNMQVSPCTPTTRSPCADLYSRTPRRPPQV
jgi:hypothetical protein